MGFGATHVNPSSRMRRHIRDLLAAGQTKGKTAENRLAEPTSGVLGTHVNPEGLTAGPFPYTLTRTNLYCQVSLLL